jgi:hypothetical protein
VEKFLGMFSIIVSYWMWHRKLRELAGDGAVSALGFAKNHLIGAGGERAAARRFAARWNWASGNETDGKETNRSDSNVAEVVRLRLSSSEFRCQGRVRK